ncbi:subunit TAF4 of transcription initiation factor TFIID [Hamiltosporidium tvaerminnensis]|uniref:Transcription initiation factor TFIID subunit 4 n=4 Tax=Hamiltosporidium TaxID=1176354 RepID=A0A4Q9LKQ2_9MICR|nr:hypothetical protein LUQ84_000904 [Hamiltosporidium tvaerminnensis]KAK1349921.1 hypothetical protein LUQ84_000909 [Hamiltosporidium tvaerminnensis]TBT97229.1 subunit TAF4 of transcription initiation factor TFIID [Hamiltosporidium tvaerminnensis]TBU08794.1 subunit TAF4 of transcription initiation factor TFIID [Hamiltosporidium magnivora]TBU09245.1 subunit TAF4 of transcription initiation factor TFIID [Hamiltosporidium magnivora]
MNKEYLATLPMEQRRAIEKAYISVVNKEISPSEFFNYCKEILGSMKYSLLFYNKPLEESPSTPKQSTREHNNNGSADLKTEHLQDIIQYTGVDLKEEEEKIFKDSEHNIGNSYVQDEDKRNKMESLLNLDLFIEFIKKICALRNISIDNDCLYVLFMALKRKLLELLEKMEEVSKFRVDSTRGEFIIRIENDIRRQLWFLEEKEKKEMEKLKIKKFESEDEGRKRVKRTIQEREDLLIKKRLSNNVALAALGGQQKSWMNVENIPISKEKESPLQSLYSPFDEKEQERKISMRSITMSDFLYVLEHDKRYNKSIFTIQQYFL